MAAVTGRYRDLQGLRQVAGGSGLLLVALWSFLFPITLRDIGSPSRFGMYQLGGLMLLGAFATFVIGARAASRWYDRNYGRVERTRRQRRVQIVIAVAGVAAFLVPFEVEIVVMNSGGVLSFNLMLGALSLWIAGYWLYLGRGFWHYATFAVAGLVVTAFSFAGLPPNTFDWHLRVLFVFMGLTTVAGGSIDHRILARALRPVASDE